MAASAAQITKKMSIINIKKCST